MNNVELNDEEISQELKRLENTRVDDKKISDTLNKQEYVNKVSQKGPLKEKINDIKLMFEMLKNNNTKNIKGELFTISVSSIAVIVGALLYIVSPLDLIPDAIPVIGFIDDAAIITATILKLNKEIQDYKKWKEESNIE